jgi:hypothetical protein
MLLHFGQVSLFIIPNCELLIENARRLHLPSGLFISWLAVALDKTESARGSLGLLSHQSGTS